MQRFASGSFQVERQGLLLDRFLRECHPGVSWNDVRRLISSGKVWVNDQRVTEPATPVAMGSSVVIRLNAARADDKPRLPPSCLVFTDSALVVVNKPAGISSVPYTPEEQGSLDQLVRELLRRQSRSPVPPLGIVHRLDRETSGLLVFARTRDALRLLKQQFRFHTTERRYLALVHGAVSSRTITSRLVRDRGDGLRGSTTNPKLGREATTHVRVLEALSGATYVECRLETGRTHQIRIHLAEAGHPLVGERVYVRGYSGVQLAAPRLMLHATSLGLDHPRTQKRLSFQVPAPEDFAKTLAGLRLK